MAERMAALKGEKGYGPVAQGDTTRPEAVAQVATITSHWAWLTKVGSRQPHNIGHDGVMGEVADGALAILLRWRSSLWKLVWKKLSIYLLAYVAISLIYRHVLLHTEHGLTFEKVVAWLKTGKQAPLTFLLGFYVSLVVKRWWEQYVKLPWPDEVATLLKAGVTKGELEGEEGENLRIRRAVVRYMILSYVLCLRRISSQVRRQFPDMQSLLDTCLVRKDEAEKIGLEEKDKISGHGSSNWWLPIKWSISLVRRAMMEDRLANPPSYANLVKAIAEFRKSLTQVVTYGHVTVPLVYTQVVHLAVHFYFAVALVGQQWVQKTMEEDPNGEGVLETMVPSLCSGKDPQELDLYVPIFLIFEFLFYFGWLNVASTLYNPFGEDDVDFELMTLINRHIKVSMKIVDDDKDDIPDLQEDTFWQPPAGARLDWEPTLAAREEGEGSVRRKWSRMSSAVVTLGQGADSTGEGRGPALPAASLA